MPIHPTAIVDPTAQIDPSAEVGPGAVIESAVVIGPMTRIYPYAYIGEGTTVGSGVQVHPFAVVGHHPQDRAWKGEPSYTHIGDETIIREYATVHRGTTPGSTTRVGRSVMIMATGHIGHNCDVGDEVVVVNGALLSAFISGNAAVQQFVRISEFAMIGGLTRVNVDVPPFLTAIVDSLVGPNTVGLRRGGFTPEERTEIRRAYRMLFRSGAHFQDAIDRVAASARTEPVKRLVEFLRAPSRRGVMRYRRFGQDEGSVWPAERDSDDVR
jgi:UDP-N-acetylglucosamine acyltransferase